MLTVCVLEISLHEILALRRIPAFTAFIVADLQIAYRYETLDKGA